MLVLSRKVGESILIGPDIAVTVIRIGPNTVRLGITAPREVPITRDELTPYWKPIPDADEGGES